MQCCTEPGLYAWQTRLLPTDYKSNPERWFVSVAQADFRPRLLLPHPPECCDYRSVSPCLAISMILPTLHILETPRFLAFMLPLNREFLILNPCRWFLDLWGSSLYPCQTLSSTWPTFQMIHMDASCIFWDHKTFTGSYWQASSLGSGMAMITIDLITVFQGKKRKNHYIT